MSEYYGEQPEDRTSPPSLQELEAMPHAELSLYAFEKQQEVERVRGLLSSLARMQKTREIEHENEIIELEMTAEQDALTGLLNKRAWIDRLEGMIEEGESNFGVMFIDLSRFKLINDMLGHVRGDEILKQTADIIESSLRHEDDYVAHDSGRYGGDEFAILCDLQPRADSDDTAEEKLAKIAKRLQQNFNTMVTKEGLETFHLDAAIGYALYEAGMTAEDVLRQADKAMYSDKYARTIDLSRDEMHRLKSVKPILDKAGVRLPEGIFEEQS